MAEQFAPAGTPKSTTRNQWQTLPPKMVEDGARRLAWIAPVSALIIVSIEVGQFYLQPDLEPVFRDPINRLLTIATAFMGFGILALYRYHAVSYTAIRGLGVVFQIVVAATISMIETTRPFDPDTPMIGLSALGPWVFMVGAFIPNRPVWTLLIALSAATTWPAAYVFNAWRLDHDALPWNRLVVWPGVNYLLAALAFLVGKRLYGATIAAERAVELGSYRLVAPIGEGGMGEVWQATHQMLARKAAIKLVRPEGLSAHQAEVAAKRFRREANVIAELQSPHTIYLYDFGSSNDGRFYYVMELLDGISLQTLVSKFGPQPAARVANILSQICASLEEAHRHQLVHRDLKPNNIMLCRVALEHDFVKVLDFGLAKCVACVDDVTQLTVEGVASGTPGYIAPEVALGESTVDHRADIYALGCVAYYMLTGTLVFQDSNPVTLALKHVQAVPDPPSLRTELPIPADFEAVIMQCLAKKAADRPATAREVALAIARCRLDPWSVDDANEWWERHLPPTSSLRSYALDSVHTPHMVQRA